MSRSRTGSHRQDVQGLRAVAVLLVALGHAGVPYLGGGFVGVDVFFVLSGFLITGLLLAEAERRGSISLVDFYVRRARRILPAAALTLLVTDIASVYVMNFVRARTAVGDSIHAAAFAANFDFAARGVDYFAQGDPPSPFLHFWSLSVEEQFYFVWPLVLLVLVRRRRLLLPGVGAVALASFAWSLHATASSPTTAYFSPFTRGWELALGAVLAVGAARLARLPRPVKAALGWLGIAAIVVAAMRLSSGTAFPGAAALAPTLGAALVIVAGLDQDRGAFGVGRLLALRPLTFVGDRSYAYYLWHWPVLVLAAAYAGHDLSVQRNLALLVFAFLLSCVSYALVENPLRTRVRSRRKTAVVAVACTAAVLATATASFGAVGREERQFEGAVAAETFTRVSFDRTAPGGILPTVIAAVHAAEQGAPLPQGLTPPLGRIRTFGAPFRPPDGCLIRQRDGNATGRVCRMGDAASKRTIVLVGDSHAFMWLPSVLEMAWHDHWAVVPFIRLGCTPGRWTTNSDRTGCRQWYRWATAQIIRLQPQVTLIGGSIGGDRGMSLSRAAAEGVLATARLLKTHGRVVVIGDPEGVNEEPVDCLLRSNASMATCTTTWPASALVAYDDIERSAKRAGVGFLATRGLLCYERRCPMVVGNTITRMDTNHLTVAYAVQIAGAFRNELRTLIAAG